MSFFFKKETQTEKAENKSKVSAITNRNGNIFTSLKQNETKYSEVSHTVSTQIVHNIPLRSCDKMTSLTQNCSTKTNTDKDRFKAAPLRSAFFSEPLTTRSASLSQNKTTIDAKPFSVSPNLIKAPNPKPIGAPVFSQNLPLQANAATTSTNELRQKVQIKVKKSAIFCDDEKKSIVPVYKTRSKYRGKLLLINNIKFVNAKEFRKGAELDELNIKELFKQIGFAVVSYRNLDKKTLMDKVTSFRKDKELTKVDIGVVVVMSHGTGKERSDSTEIACVDGKLLPTTSIINEFDSTLCPQLDGKPKIFIFQCCRGDQWDIQHDGIPPPIVARKLSDMLIAYATVPGFVAHREPENGTWYIQAICKVFMEHAHNTDVESLLKIVDSRLSSLISAHGSKQTSSFENRGFKTCYLHPQLYEK